MGGGRLDDALAQVRAQGPDQRVESEAGHLGLAAALEIAGKIAGDVGDRNRPPEWTELEIERPGVRRYRIEYVGIGHFEIGKVRSVEADRDLLVLVHWNIMKRLF